MTIEYQLIEENTISSCRL